MLGIVFWEKAKLKLSIKKLLGFCLILQIIKTVIIYIYCISFEFLLNNYV
jgi:hypothetical protein